MNCTRRSRGLPDRCTTEGSDALGLLSMSTGSEPEQTTLDSMLHRAAPEAHGSASQKEDIA